MNLPEQVKSRIRDMIANEDPTLATSLERYKDFKFTSETQLEKTFDPERRKVVQSKIDFYTDLVDFIEGEMHQRKH